jgi:hypothetical protein
MIEFGASPFYNKGLADDAMGYESLSSSLSNENFNLCNSPTSILYIFQAWKQPLILGLRIYGQN